MFKALRYKYHCSTLFKRISVAMPLTVREALDLRYISDTLALHGDIDLAATTVESIVRSDRDLNKIYLGYVNELETVLRDIKLTYSKHIVTYIITNNKYNIESTADDDESNTSMSSDVNSDVSPTDNTISFNYDCTTPPVEIDLSNMENIVYTCYNVVCKLLTPKSNRRDSNVEILHTYAKLSNVMCSPRSTSELVKEFCRHHNIPEEPILLVYQLISYDRCSSLLGSDDITKVKCSMLDDILTQLTASKCKSCYNVMTSIFDKYSHYSKGATVEDLD